MDATDIDRTIEALYTQHANEIRRRALTLTRDPAAAEDLVQEAFLRLLLDARSGRVPENPRAWLQRVTTNLAIDRGRRHTVEVRKLVELRPSRVAESPETLVIERDEQRATVAVLGGLSDADRTALTLAAHGVRGPEIARTIGRSEGATRTLLCRARGRIRDAMAATVVAAGAATAGDGSVAMIAGSWPLRSTVESSSGEIKSSRGSSLRSPLPSPVAVASS